MCDLLCTECRLLMNLCFPVEPKVNLNLNHLQEYRCGFGLERERDQRGHLSAQ